jgi:hypothetical protein
VPDRSTFRFVMRRAWRCLWPIGRIRRAS